MKPLIIVVRRMVLIASLGWFANGVAPASAQTTTAARIVEIQGTVEIIRQGAAIGVATKDTNQPPLQAFDRLRTGTNSRAALFVPGSGVVPLGAQTEVEILPQGPDSGGLFFFKGILSFIHRGEPGRMKILTRGGNAGMKGTEFVMEVAEADGTERTTLSVIDGIVSFTNELGSLTLTNGEQAVAAPGQAPRRRAGFNATNLLQWCFYYPAVLDLKDLPLTTEEQNILDESLAAYRSGDLLAALDNYPANRKPGSDAGRIYYAALLLSVGQVEKCEAALATLTAAEPSEKNARLDNALRQLIAAVKREPRPSTINHQLSTEFLAASYYEQSRAIPDTSLQAALNLAKQAVTDSPEFGFGWERVAELEFSFGRTDRALAALNKSLALAPRNAQALALKGFLLAAQNKTLEAIEWFERARAVDSALGNAWLGRGLCRIRRGDLRGGREDLLIAAALEPQRAALRSYLGKAWSDAGDDKRATNELRLAKTLDPNDPTAWLYSALNNEQHNRINDAIRDLEKSQELNNNRSVYRSGLLLDQDRAVRSANLARIYDEAGLDDVALREASKAVGADYGNFSAHLFLANSYEQLRQQNSFDLRFETPAFSEYLIASLLGPADGRLLAQPVTQQEYTRLFERDRFGFSSSTEYLSRGAWNQYAAQYGTFRNSSYALEGNYLWDPGQHTNGSVETRQVSFKFKQMLTPRDGLFVHVLDFRQESGDLAQRYYPTQAVSGLHTIIKQDPGLIVGWDHQWNDTHRTLLLFSHFNASLTQTNPHGATVLLAEAGGFFDGLAATDLTQQYESRLTVDSLELQHLIRTPCLQTVAGLRVQFGRDRLFSEQTINNGNASGLEFYFGAPGTVLANQSLVTDALRLSPYLYEYWQVSDTLQLIGGVSYDYQREPHNALFAPLEDTIKTRLCLSPKAGIIWTPSSRSVVRAAYTRSLGGADFDQSIRLEPTQLAGFVQAYRNLIPDSLAGSVGGASFETVDLSLEHRFGTSTYLAISGQLLRSSADHHVGAFRRDLFTGRGPAEQIQERLRFQERSLQISIHQLISGQFSVGLGYRLSDARFTRTYPDIDPSLCVNNCGTSRGVLQLFNINGLFRHPSGFFAGSEALWWTQDLGGNLARIEGDSLCQFNLLAGYRSPRRHVEISVGLLNLTDQDYRLHPINLYPDLPRQRTFFTRLQLNF